MNQTIMERVRSMLAHAMLSETFWVEALMTTAYVINKSPSTPLDEDIPQRLWTGKDVLYRHLKVFSCLAYVHITKDKKGNWTQRLDHAYSLDMATMSSPSTVEPSREESDLMQRHNLHEIEDYRRLGNREERSIL